MWKWLFGDSSDPLEDPPEVQNRREEIKRLNNKSRLARLGLSELNAEKDKYWNEANADKPDNVGYDLLSSELLALVRAIMAELEIRKQKEIAELEIRKQKEIAELEIKKQKEKSKRKAKEDAKQKKRLADARKSRLAREAEEAKRLGNKPARKVDNLDVKSQRKKLLSDAIDKHYTTLRRNFNRLLRINDYGAIEFDERRQEFDKFLKSVGLTQHFGRLSRLQDSKPHNLSGEQADRAYKSLIKRIKADSEKEVNAGFNPDTLPDDGHDFEHWVAENLEKFGWETNVSVSSGDQGVDVIARISECVVAIQCKLYSGSVGNKAVQEIIAGKTFYDAKHAVVITNAKYTKSAIELAASNNVFLLSHLDIPNLKSILKK